MIFACGTISALARLEVAVGLARLRERVGAADANLKGVVADPGQYTLGAPQELLARQGVPGQGGTGEEEGSLGVEGLRIQRRDRAARGAEEHHVAAGLEAV